MFVSDLCSLIVLAPRSRNPEYFRDRTYNPALVMRAQLNKQKRKIRAISTREIRFDGSSAIHAAAIKLDVERLKNSPRGQSALFVLDK